MLNSNSCRASFLSQMSLICLLHPRTSFRRTTVGTMHSFSLITFIDLDEAVQQLNSSTSSVCLTACHLSQACHHYTITENEQLMFIISNYKSPISLSLVKYLKNSPTSNYILCCEKNIWSSMNFSCFCCANLGGNNCHQTFAIIGNEAFILLLRNFGMLFFEELF